MSFFFVCVCVCGGGGGAGGEWGSCQTATRFNINIPHFDSSFTRFYLPNNYLLIKSSLPTLITLNSAFKYISLKHS